MKIFAVKREGKWILYLYNTKLPKIFGFLPIATVTIKMHQQHEQHWKSQIIFLNDKNLLLVPKTLENGFSSCFSNLTPQ